AIGNDRTAIRLSPSGTFNGMSDKTPVKTFSYLVDKLNKHKLAYLHIMEPYAPPGKTYIPQDLYLQDREVTKHFRKIYEGNLLTNSGFTIDEANDYISDDIADMVAF
ncbi:MAG: alkene reductase, partial [Candidatus Kapaibacterium sp.]